MRRPFLRLSGSISFLFCFLPEVLNHLHWRELIWIQILGPQLIKGMKGPKHVPQPCASVSSSMKWAHSLHQWAVQRSKQDNAGRTRAHLEHGGEVGDQWQPPSPSLFSFIRCKTERPRTQKGSVGFETKLKSVPERMWERNSSVLHLCYMGPTHVLSFHATGPYELVRKDTPLFRAQGNKQEQFYSTSRGRTSLKHGSTCFQSLGLLGNKHFNRCYERAPYQKMPGSQEIFFPGNQNFENTP